MRSDCMHPRRFLRGQNISRLVRPPFRLSFLCLVPHLKAVFASDFAEGNLTDTTTTGLARSLSGASDHSAYVDEFEDSDEESEDDDAIFPSTTSIQEQEEYHDAHGDSDAVEGESLREGSPESHSEAKGKDGLGITITPAPTNVPGPAKTVIEVKDVAYRTYKSILYWVRHLFCTTPPSASDAQQFPSSYTQTISCLLRSRRRSTNLDTTSRAT